MFLDALDKGCGKSMVLALRLRRTAVPVSSRCSREFFDPVLCRDPAMWMERSEIDFESRGFPAATYSHQVGLVSRLKVSSHQKLLGTGFALVELVAHLQCSLEMMQRAASLEDLEDAARAAYPEIHEVGEDHGGAVGANPVLCCSHCLTLCAAITEPVVTLTTISLPAKHLETFYTRRALTPVSKTN